MLFNLLNIVQNYAGVINANNALFTLNFALYKEQLIEKELGGIYNEGDLERY